MGTSERPVTLPTIQMGQKISIKIPPRFPAQLPDGALIDERYEIRGVLGRGGFADVYDGFDRVDQRAVAIKVLKFMGGPDLQRNIERRFVQDARVASLITHPNVVRILACLNAMTVEIPGTDRAVYNRLHIIMEKLEGHTLSTIIREQGRLAPLRALRLVLESLEGLAEGHKLGVVHKDIKPGNLFLTWPGTDIEILKVLDFGIARDIGSKQAQLTNPGGTFCTPRYAAPEYLRDGRVTPAVDVYQMGLVLAEMLTGEPVVKGKSLFECTLAHKNGVELDALLGRSVFGPVLRRALARNPSDRYPDAQLFSDALRELLPH